MLGPGARRRIRDEPVDGAKQLPFAANEIARELDDARR